MNKKIISLFLIYFFQFLATSCETCSCELMKTFERTYNGLDIKAWDTAGFQNSEVSDTVNKNSFGLSILLDFGLNQISHSKTRSTFSAFGFASAYACSCQPDQFINVDPIDIIEIKVTDTQSQEKTDITAHFASYDFNGEYIPINEALKNKVDWIDRFQLDMIEYDNIPNTSIFEVKIILQSGTELIEQTQKINFK